MSERDKSFLLILRLKLGKRFPERQKNFLKQNGGSHHCGPSLASILAQHLLSVKEWAATHYSDEDSC